MDEMMNFFSRKMAFVLGNGLDCDITFSLDAESCTSCFYWPQSAFDIVAPARKYTGWIKVFIADLIVYNLFLNEQFELVLAQRLDLVQNII